MCLLENGTTIWDAYRLYIYENNGERKYVDLETCLGMGGMHAYKNWKCSPLEPDNSKGKFKQQYDWNSIWECDGFLLAQSDKVECVAYSYCVG